MADTTERELAEQRYVELAHDYESNPIGSRDWVIFWNGWRERSELAATPPADAALADESESVVAGLRRANELLRRDGYHPEGFDFSKAANFIVRITDALRARQPAVPAELVTAALGTGNTEKLYVPVHIAVEAAHIAARGQHAAAIEYAHRYAQPAAQVAQVPDVTVTAAQHVMKAIAKSMSGADDEMSDRLAFLEGQNAELLAQRDAYKGWYDKHTERVAKAIAGLKANRPQFVGYGHDKHGNIVPITMPAQVAQAVPEGFVMVPVEPTPEMVMAFMKEFYKKEKSFDTAACYRAMLAASQQTGGE